MSNRKKVFLITGFNNWGKTSIIQKIFDRKKFGKLEAYELPDSKYKFVVQQNSNDDLNIAIFTGVVKEKLEANENLVCAFCPTTKSSNNSNNSKDFLVDTLNEYDIYILYIVHKWDNHASLNIEEIKKYYDGIPNITHCPIGEKDPVVKIGVFKDKILQIMKQSI
jgi:hypothetical protein